MLLAPDLRDWVAKGHLARWVNDLVEHALDLSVIYDDYTEVCGGLPYDPRLMVKVLIYGYSQGSRPGGRWSGAVMMMSRSGS